MRKLILCLLCSIFIFTGCSLSNYRNIKKVKRVEEPSENNDKKESTEKDRSTSEKEDIKDNSKDNAEEEKRSLEEVIINDNITEEVKDYIINGQGDKPEASKLKWSKTFLNEVDIKSLYNQYKIDGGNSEDLETFAKYITLHAPVSENWKELFEKDLYDAYGEKVVKLEHLNDDLYQAYIEKDGKEIPYVVVSSRTGHFHG